MKGVNYWEQFIHTGSIGDYLKFKDSTAPEDKKEQKQLGDNLYAGVSNRNGNRAEDSAYRGIR